MNRVSLAIVVLALAFGGMLGYSLAFVRLYQEVQTAEGTPPLPPSLPETRPETPALDLSSGPVPFPTVIRENAGQSVLPLDSACEPVLDAIALAADATLAKLNSPNSPLIGLRRINEASRFFEDSLQILLDQHPDLICQIPKTAAGKSQRSGYPDLEIIHRPSGRVYYLDPKLYESSSRNSSLRTFYYTPRSNTSKILRPAHHLLIGFAHDGNDGQWQFESWSLVDLFQTQLTLKSEYNASNRDLYQQESIVRTASAEHRQNAPSPTD